jgi:hypothetical protein
MPEHYPYVALRRIHQPDTLLYPYNEGDGLPANAVKEWGLVVGEDVMPADTGVITRPGDDAPRAEWEAFAIGQGRDPVEVRDASMKDLRGIPAPDPEQPAQALPRPGEVPPPPADDAVKAEWVRAAVARGADEEWAGAKGTTKADLIAFVDESEAGSPGAADEQPTDTVAAAANDANG